MAELSNDERQSKELRQDQFNRRSTDTDERILEKILGFERSTHDQITVLSTKLSIMENQQGHISGKIEMLVSKLEFTPVKLLVYGMTSIILTAVMGALVALVVSK